jgi:hypothetical protein
MKEEGEKRKSKTLIVVISKAKAFVKIDGFHFAFGGSAFDSPISQSVVEIDRQKAPEIRLDGSGILRSDHHRNFSDLKRNNLRRPSSYLLYSRQIRYQEPLSTKTSN